MKRLSILIFVITALNLQSIASVTITGSTKEVITERPAQSTGLDKVFVVYNTDGCSATYTSSTSSTVKWFRFSNLGGGYAQEVTGIIHNENEWTLPRLEGDMGYIIEEGTSRHYVWVVNYAAHRMRADAITPSPEQECDMSALIFNGAAPRINYYTINGRQMELGRDIEIAYKTLTYSESTGSFVQEDVVRQSSSLESTIHVPAPYCDTAFELSGDRFLKAWGEEIVLSSPTLKATAVNAVTSVQQEQRVSSNEKRPENESGLGGSAPATVDFNASVTDAAVFTEWQFSRDPEFNDISLRFNELDVTYTFRDEGETYVRFVCANDQGTCEYSSETYTVQIGRSSLECPNAFSPGASEGVNDEWKVSYQSIIDFDCHIFNRWGKELARLTDPSQGWDGKVGGKVVPAGVYFYVITATGADGKKYKLSGDINVINYR